LNSSIKLSILDSRKNVNICQRVAEHPRSIIMHLDVGLFVKIAEFWSLDDKCNKLFAYIIPKFKMIWYSKQKQNCIMRDNHPLVWNKLWAVNDNKQGIRWLIRSTGALADHMMCCRFATKELSCCGFVHVLKLDNNNTASVGPYSVRGPVMARQMAKQFDIQSSAMNDERTHPKSVTWPNANSPWRDQIQR
jgi:hypothetical protein